MNSCHLPSHESSLSRNSSPHAVCHDPEAFPPSEDEVLMEFRVRSSKDAISWDEDGDHDELMDSSSMF